MSDTKPTPMNASQFAGVMRNSYRTLTFTHAGQEFAIAVRPLAPADIDRGSEYVRLVTAPMRKDESGAEVIDYENEDFGKQMREAREKEAVTLLDLAWQGGIEGSTVEEKCAWVGANIPVSVASGILSAILSISRSTEIEHALFT